jgi:predicted RNase H-like nuclease (RuvC/YqgF family)
MSKTGEQGKVPPSPLNKDDNPIVVEDGANMETSMAPTLEELMRRLEELTAENKKLRAKAKSKKTKGNSSSSEEEDSSFEEDVSKKKRKEEEITISLLTTQCLLITIICLALPFILPYLLAKLLILMELVITNGSIA